MYKNVVFIHNLIIILQLLSGQPPDGEESTPADVVEGTTPEEQIVSSAVLIHPLTITQYR